MTHELVKSSTPINLGIKLTTQSTEHTPLLPRVLEHHNIGEQVKVGTQLRHVTVENEPNQLIQEMHGERNVLPRQKLKPKEFRELCFNHNVG